MASCCLGLICPCFYHVEKPSKDPDGASTTELTCCFREWLIKKMRARRIRKFREAFDFFDANHDGYVTTDELEAAMSKCGVYPSKLELRLVMTQGDADGNGVITFDEFAALMDTQKNRSKYDKRQLWQQFKLFDKDNDGFIELDEMLAIVTQLSLGRYFPREIIDKLFREADVDCDGKISFDEFVMAVN
ncbi:Calmodulin-like protein 3 [Aphelenchoides fujianensis]|nr:Calmodulin-like protein 3 [Aphelenchoides fujianensis]